MKASIDERHIETHSVTVNIASFKCHTDSINSIAQQATERVVNSGRSRYRDRSILWLKEMPFEEQSKVSAYYKPATFTMSGSFDIVTIFLSPTVELSPWTYFDELPATIQEADFCLLPTATGLGLQENRDFNLDFIEHYKALQAGVDGKVSLKAELSTVAITKIKLNPLLLWPAVSSVSDEGQLRLILRELWRQVEDWRISENTLGSYPPVSLGLAVGWNELTVVAHNENPVTLMRLAVRLRQTLATIKRGGSSDIAHVCKTTTTDVGHDYRLRKCAQETYRSISTEEASVSAERLIAAAYEIANVGKAGTPKEDSQSFLQVMCSASPGHEQRIMQLLKELEKEFGESGISSEPGGLGSMFLGSGKNEFWSPRIYIREEPPPIVAWALVFLVQVWLRYGGRPEPNAARLTDALDFDIRFASHDDFGSSAEALPEAHVRKIPSANLLPKAVSDMLSVSPEGAQISATDGETNRLRELRLEMAYLQVPYSISEEVLHLFKMFYWAFEQEDRWNDMAEMIPVVLGFASSVKGHRRWWNSGQARVSMKPWVAHREASRVKLVRESIRQALDSYTRYDLPQFLNAFRSSLYGRCFAGHIDGRAPGPALRSRNLSYQLLGLVNMMLNAVVEVTVGQRACMVIIDDSPSPSISWPCDIAIAAVNPGTFENPILLESLAHEAGYMLLRELIRDSDDPSWRKHLWVKADNYDPNRIASLEVLRKGIQRLNYDVFCGRLADGSEDDTILFLESASDFIEFKLLGYRDVHEWASSFLLRALLVSSPNTEARSSEGVALPPLIDEDVMLTNILRIALVKTAEFLSTRGSEVLERGGLKDQLRGELEALRSYLYHNAPLGLSGEVASIVSNKDEWSAFLATHLFHGFAGLASERSLGALTNCYSAIAEFLQPPSEGYASTGRFWPRIAQALTGLRHAVLDGLLPALYVLHWMSHDDRRRARERSLGQGLEASAELKEESVPWTSAILPLAVHEMIKKAREQGLDLEIGEINSVIFQRGRILQRTDAGLQRTGDATRSFLTSLLALLPAWRLELIESVSRMVEVDEP